jgi:hypothetical protein
MTGNIVSLHSHPAITPEILLQRYLRLMPLADARAADAREVHRWFEARILEIAEVVLDRDFASVKDVRAAMCN